MTKKKCAYCHELYDSNRDHDCSEKRRRQCDENLVDSILETAVEIAIGESLFSGDDSSSSDSGSSDSSWDGGGGGFDGGGASGEF